MSGVHLTPKELKAQERAEKALAGIPTNGSLRMILDAISHCVPVAAGLLQSVNDAELTTLSGHGVDIPLYIHEAWMSTPRDHLSRAFGPLFKAKVGDFWGATDLARSLQALLPVLEHLPAYALGEGAGYKIMTRPAPIKGTEHYWLALITAPSQRFGPRTKLLLRGLTQAVQDAVLRIQLPLVAMRPLTSLIVEQDSVGYVVMTRDGDVRETNREAHEFAQHYGTTAGANRSRYMLAELLALVKKTKKKQWLSGGLSIPRADKVLDIRRYALRARPHALAEDLDLLVLRERAVGAPSARRSIPLPDDGQDLPLRQREVTELLVNTGLTYQGIAEQLNISPGTVRTVVMHVYKAYGVHDRDDLVRHCLSMPVAKKQPATTKKSGKP